MCPFPGNAGHNSSFQGHPLVNRENICVNQLAHPSSECFATLKAHIYPTRFPTANRYSVSAAELLTFPHTATSKTVVSSLANTTCSLLLYNLPTPHPLVYSSGGFSPWHESNVGNKPFYVTNDKSSPSQPSLFGQPMGGGELTFSPHRGGELFLGLQKNLQRLPRSLDSCQNVIWCGEAYFIRANG